MLIDFVPAAGCQYKSHITKQIKPTVKTFIGIAFPQ